MKTNHRAKRSIILVLALVIFASLTWVLFSQTPATPAPAASSSSSAIFTPAHRSLASAVREYFNVRSTPVQPIAYTHKVHVSKEGADLKCVFCHEGVDKGPMAKIPTINKCMVCHDITATDKPEVQKILAYQAKGEDIPWQRVYGFPAISHVRFNHAPHIRNGVECATCHGDIPNMTQAQRVVDHTMGFCLKCHEQRKVSNDCMTCHY